MKYLFLVWSGIWRKRTRAALILLQVSVAFTLFGVLQGLDTGIRQAINKAHANRMYVLSRVSSGDSLPLGLLADIKRLRSLRLLAAHARVRSSARSLCVATAGRSANALRFNRL
jgi:putative ABC transport system permease protein